LFVTLNSVRKTLLTLRKASKMNIREDASAGGWIIGNLPGTIPSPIPKKFVKKASGGQFAAKQQAEEVSGFADASAPSNSNYQTTTLSPTQTAKKPKMKKLKEYYEKNIVELAKVCPECNNTGVVKKFGNNILCTACNTDPRANDPKVIGKQAKDMLTTGRTTPVDEVAQGTPNGQYGKFVDQRVAHNKGHKFNKDCPDCKEAKRLGKNPETYRFNKEDVVTSLEDIYPTLEAYKASPKMLSRVKYNVHPKLSKMLRDRLAARKPKSKGYTPSQGTLGLAAARKAQMSHSKKDNVEEATDAEKLAAIRADHAKRKGEAWKLKPVKPDKPVKVKEDFGSGNFGTLTRTFPLKNEAKKKPNNSASVQSKPMASLSAKPMMGSSNDNRVSEDVVLEKSNDELKKFTGGAKGNLKRKYLGAARGRTATGKPAHPIEVDPTIKVSNDINKVVK
jgi:hypothetical protein